MATYLARPVALVAVESPVDVVDIPTVETWDRHDCKVTVTQPEGFMCKVQLRAKLDLPPDQVFDLLVAEDNSRFFSTIAAVTYRKVLEDNRKGKQKVEVEQAAQWRFLFFSGYFLTRLFVLQDKPEGTIEFKLAKEGTMKNFEGRWEVRPFDQHALDSVSGRSNVWSDLGYRFKTAIGGGKTESTLVTLEQSILPKVKVPAWFRGYMVKVTSSIIQTIVKDLRGEIDRIKKGKPIPKTQAKKLEQATKLIKKRAKKERAAASCSIRRRIAPAEILF